MRTQLFFILSVLAAICLNIVALPESFETYRPEFLVLVVYYFVLYHDKVIGFVNVFLTGILCDVITGTILGHHAFVYLLISLIVYQNRQDWVRSDLIKSMVCVGAISCLAFLSNYGIDLVFKESKMGLEAWRSVLMTMAFWPIGYGYHNARNQPSRRQFKF